MLTLEKVNQPLSTQPQKNLNKLFDEIITKINDRKVIEFLVRANFMQGIFQLSSNTTVKYLRQLMPLLLEKLDNKEEVSVVEVVELVSMITTIIRPSSQSSGASKRLIDKALKKSSDTAFSTVNPFYEIYRKHTEVTFEELIYQEQLMTLINELFQLDNLGKADIYRRYFESNDDTKLEKLREEFKELYKKTVPIKYMKEFWTFIVSVAGYSFNKSHAVSYTILSLITVYLRSFPEYALKYISACINNAKADQKQTRLEKIAIYVNYFLKFNVKVLFPKVNYTNYLTKPVTVDGNEVIILAIDVLDGIGKVVSNCLSSRNDFVSLDEFLKWSYEQVTTNITEAGKETNTSIFSKDVYKTLIEIDYFTPLTNMSKAELKEYIETFTIKSQEYREAKVLKSGEIKYKPKNNAKIREEIISFNDKTVLVELSEPLLSDFKNKLDVNIDEPIYITQYNYLKFLLYNPCDKYLPMLHEGLNDDYLEAICLIENQTFGAKGDYKYSRITCKWDSQHPLDEVFYIPNFTSTIRKKSIIKVFYSFNKNKFGEMSFKYHSHELLEILD